MKIILSHTEAVDLCRSRMKKELLGSMVKDLVTEAKISINTPHKKKVTK